MLLRTSVFKFKFTIFSFSIMGTITRRCFSTMLSIAYFLCHNLLIYIYMCYALVLSLNLIFSILGQIFSLILIFDIIIRFVWSRRCATVPPRSIKLVILVIPVIPSSHCIFHGTDCKMNLANKKKAIFWRFNSE